MSSQNYSIVEEEFNSLQTLTPKEKYKKIRSVASLAETALKTANDVDEIGFYAKIFKMANNSRLLNKAKVKEFELKGISEVKTLKTKLGSVNIESGLISVGDPALSYKNEYDTKKIVEEMNQGNFYCIGSGGDGTFDVTLRQVGVDEPLLGPKEYKFITNNSKTSVIKITSGFVKCADFWDVSRSAVGGVGYEIENGFYKTAFYLKEIRDKYFGFVVVLSKTDKIYAPELTEIETLG